MSRAPRFELVDEGSTNHCTWQAHDHERVFESDGARDRFLELLRKYKKRHGIEINSYCLMGTHPHVVCTATKGQKEFSKFWKVVNHQFACWFNKRHNRRGQVVMERMRSPKIQPGGNHQLTVMRYGDLNPVRAGLVKKPQDWPWSSYRFYAYGEPNDLIDPAPEYLALGLTAPQRRIAYRNLFTTPLSNVLRERRPELVIAPFVGDDEWVLSRMKAAGLCRRRRTGGAFT